MIYTIVAIIREKLVEFNVHAGLELRAENKTVREEIEF